MFDVIRPRPHVADGSAHQPHPGQGTNHEGFSLWLKFTVHLQFRLILYTLSTDTPIERSGGRQEPIVHARRTYVAIQATAAAATDNVLAGT
jgi:hypothetical protein